MRLRLPSCWIEMGLSLWVAMLAIGLLADRLHGQAQPASGPAGGNPELGVVHGLDGAWKLGYPTRFRLPADAASANGSMLEVQTVDGDGVPVVYRHAISQGQGEREMIVRHGRSSLPIAWRIDPGSGASAGWVRLEDAQRGLALPPEQPWVVALGPDMQVDRWALRSTIGQQLPSFQVSSLAAPSQLPQSAAAYEGVDLVLLATSDAAFLQSIDPVASKALVDWVASGGKILISAGQQSEELAKLPWLASLLPGKLGAIVEGVAPGPVESWVGSETQLAPLRCASLKEVSGVVLLSVLTPRRETLPLVVRRPYGNGQVTFVATDLDASSFLEWPDAGKWWEKLALESWQKAERSGSRDVTARSQVGYSDLSGQLRAALDYFPGVRTASLSLLAALLIGFLLIVGPIDYFVFVRWLKKPQYAWWTLLLASLATSWGIARLTGSWKPKELRWNHLAVVDFAPMHRAALGHAWGHVYSGSRQRYQLASQVTMPGIERPIDAPLDWLGTPGTGLGGLDSSIVADRGMPQYTIEPSTGGEVALSSSAGQIVGVGVPAAGSKSFQTSWQVAWEPAMESSFQLVPGSDLLQGDWTNPLPVDLLDGVVLFRNWIYPLPTRVQAGQRQVFNLRTVPKDLSRTLQRRRVVEGNEQGRPWDPLLRDDLGPLAMMLMFHRAAGGRGFTSLDHRFLGSLDLSDHLKMDQAIVVGRLEKPLWQLRLHDSQKELTLQEGQQQTWARILVPVQTQTKSPGRSVSAITPSSPISPASPEPALQGGSSLQRPGAIAP
ncbi:MAG: hypothetical protein ACK57Y_00205 [Pirellulaceae bacterium]